MTGAFAGLLLAGGQPAFVESRIDVATDRFEYQLADADGDGRVDLMVTSADADERTLRLWRQRADSSYGADPDFRMSVPPDVVSWALHDVRADPGREIVLLTRGGIFSLTPSKPGLQGNLRRELSLPLFPDVADPQRLPCWRLAKDVDGDGRAELLVVSEGELLAFAVVPDEGAGTRLERRLAVPCVERQRRDSTARVSFGDSGVEASSRGGFASFFAGARSSRPALGNLRLLAHRRSYTLPGLSDWDRDGRIDMVDLGPTGIALRLQQGDGAFPAEPRRLALPAAIGRGPGAEGESGDVDSRVELRDVDGDGREELVAFVKSESGDRGSVALFFPRAADGTPAEQPSARVKLAGMSVEFGLVDVDHDGFVDVTAQVLDVPTGLTSLATIRLDMAFHVFRGGPGATLSRAPQVTLARSFRPEELTRVQETLLLRIDGDFDRDGVNDLVSTRLDGRVEIRSVRRDGAALELVDAPISSFQPPAPVSRLETWDLSVDGVADLTLRHERGFTLFVSVPGDRR